MVYFVLSGNTAATICICVVSDGFWARIAEGSTANALWPPNSIYSLSNFLQKKKIASPYSSKILEILSFFFLSHLPVGNRTAWFQRL